MGKTLGFFYKDTALVEEKNLEKTLDRLETETQNMRKATAMGYGDERASLNLAFDEKSLKAVEKLVEEKREIKPEYLIVVGIGGSNLGTKAVQEAVLGKTHNALTDKTRVLYADTTDPDSVSSIIKTIKPVLEKKGEIVLNVVSKSGGTTETIVNFEVLADLLEKHKKNYEENVVVTTGKDSKLFRFAEEKGFPTLKIPEKVGGRYSVFSPVGLFPLGLLGINLGELLKGAKEMRQKCLSKKQEQNNAAKSAAIIYLHREKNTRIHNMFLFSNDLESTGKWHRQLMGESLGKEYDKNKKKVFEGITPTVSIGSTDLHSIAQLYLGGPMDKFTTFVSVNENKDSVKLPDKKEYSKLLKHVQGKSLQQVMNAILSGVKKAYVEAKRPFAHIVLPDKKEHTMGEFLQLKMIETMYLGFLLNVNPFDQPNVESYKTETKKILSSQKK